MATAESKLPLEPLKQLGLLTPVEGRNPSGIERRLDSRSAFPYHLLLTPLDDESVSALHSTKVIGTNIGANGFCFFHKSPLPYRLVRLTAIDPRLQELGLGDLHFALVMKWCRFLKVGQYESGGRIIWPHARVA